MCALKLSLGSVQGFVKRTQVIFHHIVARGQTDADGDERARNAAACDGLGRYNVMANRPPPARHLHF